MVSTLQDLPRLDLSKTVQYGVSNPKSYTLRNSTHRTAHLDSYLESDYVGLKLLYDRNPYLCFTPREPRAKCLGPLIYVFERFANWANPSMQINDYITFDKISKANTTMNVAETFQFCRHFGIIPRISKPEVMAIFAMTVSSQETSKYDDDMLLEDFERHKARNSRDLTEQRFPFFLCRIAIVMFSRDEPSLSPLQKVQKFIKCFRLNEAKYVKQIADNAKANKSKSRRTSHSDYYLHKKTGLTAGGALGLEKITKYLKSILKDVDLCHVVRPFYDLQMKQKKRDWVPFANNHLNISRIHITNNINVLDDYRYAIRIFNKHSSKSIFFHIVPEHVPKYLTFKFKNRVLSPGMGSTIFIKFTTNHQLIRRLNGKKLRSHIPISIMEKGSHQRRQNGGHRKQRILQEITIPITASFQFIKHDDKDIFLPASISTPRDYPIKHVNEHYR